MADVLVQGDTGPAITGTIHKRGDTADLEDLTNASVNFQMRRARDRKMMVDAVATIVDPASGTVSYTLEENDTAIPGDYVYQWQVTYVDGKKQTTFEAKELTIRRR
jgi:predicted secreted Zn-dependent protease